VCVRVSVFGFLKLMCDEKGVKIEEEERFINTLLASRSNSRFT
jgi:hypothetical protein